MGINNQCSVVEHTIDNIINSNDKFCNMIGLSADKIEGQSLSNFVIDEYWDQLENKFKNIENKNDKLGCNIEIQTNDGDSVSVISVSSLNSNNTIETIFIDFDSNKDNEINSSLKNSAIHSAPVGITIANIKLEDEPLIYINDGFVDITGYERQEVIGQNCRFLQGEKTSELKVKKLRKAIDKGEMETVELLNYKKDGAEFWNRITITPIQNNSDEITHYLGFQEDITDSKICEKKKTVFEKHVEKSNDAMFVTDKSWVIEYVNPSFEKITGYNQSEVIGEKADILNPKNENNIVYNKIKNTLNDGSTWQGELMSIKKSGERYNSKQTITPIINSQNEITNFTVIQEDITYEQINKQILNVLNRVMRHNLRTSLNVIEGYAEALKEDSDYNQNRMAAGAISDRTSKMKKISEKMSHIRNLINGIDEPTKFTLKNIFDITESYNDELIEINMDKKFYDRQIKYGDLFMMALKESIQNSLDSKNSKVEIDVKKSNNNKHKNLIEFVVKNNSKKYEKEKWEIIKKGEETPLKHTDGLDLWVLYWSLKAMGGTVKYEKINSGGTQFKLCVPMIPV